MTPIKFPQANVVFAEDQPEYQPLPAWREPRGQGIVISCWQLTWWERLRVLWTGRVWLSQMTFGEKLQPQLPSIESPFEERWDGEPG